MKFEISDCHHVVNIADCLCALYVNNGFESRQMTSGTHGPISTIITTHIRTQRPDICSNPPGSSNCVSTCIYYSRQALPTFMCAVVLDELNALILLLPKFDMSILRSRHHEVCTGAACNLRNLCVQSHVDAT